MSRNKVDTYFSKDKKVVKRCIDCHNLLPKTSKHHLFCDKCWEIRQLQILRNDVTR